MSNTEVGSNSDPTAWLTRAVRKNPEGLLLLGAGLALLMRTGGKSQSRASTSSRRDQTAGTEGPYGPYGMDGMNGMKQTGERVSEQAASTTEQLRASIGSTTEFVSRKADEVQNQATEAASGAMDSGQRMMNSALESGQKAMNSAMQSGQQAVNSITAQPFLVALMGIGTGLALASLLPETDIEHRAFQDAGKTLAETAQDAGKRIASATSEVGDKLAEVAAQRGLDKNGVRDLAGELSDTFTTALNDKDGEKSDNQPAADGERAGSDLHDATQGSQAP
jgi:hypothetical protein